MMMTMIVPILGAVPSKFTLDSGYTEDCVNVHAVIDLDPTVGGVGRGAEVFKYKTSDDISEFQGIDFSGFPVAECKVSLVKKGKKAVMVLQSIKFVDDKKSK